MDYAAEMGWRYCLIDALWDKQIGYQKLEDLIGYARDKGVGILLWYNSAGDFNSAPQTPRNFLLTHERRGREFKRLKAMGVAGLKIDFFGGDGQSMIGYYLGPTLSSTSRRFASPGARPTTCARPMIYSCGRMRSHPTLRSHVL
ncbi:MAG: glycoside hydrolase family 97 catalytic domain-containing protein [Acidobacteriota bacterium]|nr:glycoside hydrolase family 97 catalytic domain-containing protein [Acidobacteriota bacterium]